MVTAAQLHACANWNAEKGCELFRQHHYEKNNVLYEEMLRDYTRHIRTADRLRRQAFLIERRSRR